MAFTTTICPKCGRKINKSDLMLVETKIKTRIKCCPHCVKFIDVERQLTLQGKTVYKQDEIEKPIFASTERLKSAPERSLFQDEKRDLKEIKIKGPFYQQSEAEKPELETVTTNDKKAFFSFGEKDQTDTASLQEKPSESKIEEKKFFKEPKEIKEETEREEPLKELKEGFEELPTKEPEKAEIKEEKTAETEKLAKELDEKLKEKDAMIQELQRKLIETEQRVSAESAKPEQLKPEEAAVEIRKEKEIEEVATEKPVKTEVPKIEIISGVPKVEMEEVKQKPPVEIKEEKKPDESIAVKDEIQEEKASNQPLELGKPSDGLGEESKLEDTKFELNHLDLKVIKKLRETGESRVSVLAGLLNEDEYEVFRSLKKLKKFGLCREKTVEMHEIEKPAEGSVESELEEEITVAVAPPEEAEASPISFEKVEGIVEESVESELEEETPETAVPEEAEALQAEQPMQDLEVSGEKEISANPEKVEEIAEESVEQELEDPSVSESPEIELKEEVEEKRPYKELGKAEELKPEESAVEVKKEIVEEGIKEKPIEKTVKIMKKQKTEEPESLKKEVKETKEEIEKKKKLKTAWQSEWMVASKEMENILSSTMAKKESERKKKVKTKQKSIPSSLKVKLKKAKTKKKKKK